MTHQYLKLNMRKQLRKLSNDPSSGREQGQQPETFQLSDIERDNLLKLPFLTEQRLRHEHHIAHLALRYWRANNSDAARFLTDWNKSQEFSNAVSSDTTPASPESDSTPLGMGSEASNLSIFLTAAAHDRALKQFYMSQQNKEQEAED